MAMSLYKTRQIILDTNDKDNIDIDYKRNMILSGEALMGIASHQHILTSGKNSLLPQIAP